MASYDVYSDGVSSYLIYVLHHENGEDEYKLVSRCCEQADELIKQLVKVRKVANCIKEELDYSHSEFLEDYLFDVWNVKRRRIPAGFSWKCTCENKIGITPEYEVEKLDLKHLVEQWRANNNNEAILIDSGFCDLSIS